MGQHLVDSVLLGAAMGQHFVDSVRWRVEAHA